MSDLMTRCIDAYWEQGLSINGIHSTLRMKAVFELLAKEIRTWAPDPKTAKICHLAVNEIANRLVEESSGPLQQSGNSGEAQGAESQEGNG